MSKLPPTWSVTTLKTVANLVTGNTPSTKSPEFYGGVIPFVKPGDLDRADPITRTEQSLTTLGAEQSRLVRAGSVLVSCIGNLGKVGFAGSPLATNQQINSAEFHPNVVNDRYGFYACKTLKSWMEQEASATTIAILNKGKFGEAPLALAPIAEQKRIADKLDTVLTRVAAVNTRLARVAPLLKRFRQSVLAAATSGRLTEDWRGLDAPDSPWREVLLGDVIQEMRNGLSAKPDESQEGRKILRISAVRPGALDVSDHRYLTTEENEASVYSLKKGDVLFTRYNGSLEYVGVCAMVSENLPDYVYPDKLIRVRANVNATLPKYLELAASASGARTQIEGFVKSSAGQKGISGGDLKALRISLPTLGEQAEIVRRVETLFAFADRLEARLQAAQTAADRLTPSLLAKAFRGELVPQDPNDEPASELLRRLAGSAPTSVTKRGRKKTLDASA